MDDGEMTIVGLEQFWRDCLLLLLNDDERSLIGVHKIMLNKLSESSRDFSNMIGMGVYDIIEYPLKSWMLSEYVTQLEDVDRIYLQDICDRWTFPERLCNYLPYNMDYTDDVVCSVNQLDVICRELVKDCKSSRAFATLYIPHIDEGEISIPNLQYVQFLIKDNKLYLVVMFSEHNFYKDFIKDILFIKYLGLSICECLNEYYPELQLYMLDYNCGKIYIDEEDVKIIEEEFDFNE